VNPAFLAAQLQYTVLGSRLKPEDPSTALHNQAFEFWRGFWDEVYLSVGSAEKTNPDQFRRLDALSVISNRGRIIALHGYTFFNLDQQCDRHHSFFAGSFTPKAMRAMDDLGMRYVMTMEYFSVAPEWRKRSHDVAMGLVLLSLSQKFFLETEAEMWIGAPRADIGVAKLCYSMGATALDQGLMLHGAKTDLIGVPRHDAKWVGSEADKALVESLWEKRDLRWQPETGAPSLRRAA
jgi:hypothetical protein